MIEDYFTDTVFILRREYDLNNEVTETEDEYKCRIDHTDEVIKGADGNERQASYRIYLSPSAVVDLKDHVRIGELRGVDEVDTKSFPILTKSRHAGFDEHHIRLTI